MTVITANGASFKYGNNHVLHDMVFSSSPGEFQAITGPNGSGKTTLLKGMAGLIRPCAGSIKLNGRSISTFSREDIAKEIALVPQNAVLPELFTVMDIVLMGRTPHLGFLRYESSKDVSIAVRAMEITQTEHLSTKRINELSGGERQRVIIARALTQEAEILLMDEPTANLDINYQAEILNFLRGLCREQNLTVIAALHDLNLASQYCDRITMLKGGRLWRQGRPAEVLDADSVKQVFGVDTYVFNHPVNGLPVALISRGLRRNGDQDPS
jgi:iron complex transport system ATP-binding protein